MIKQKKALIAGGAVVIIGCAWWGLSAYATNKAEEKLVAFLEKTDQRNNVHWKHLSASPFGSSTLKDVTIGSPSKPLATIDTVKISGLRDERDRQSGDVSLEGVALPNGSSVLNELAFFRQAGKIDLPAATFNARWDYRRDDNEADLFLALQQPQALNAELSLEVESINAAAGLVDASTLGAFAMLGAMGIGRMDRALEPLGKIRIKHAKFSVKDDGYVKRSIELYKRHNIAAIPGEGNPDKQREKAFEKMISDYKKTCIKSNDMAGFKDNEDACKALANFAGGDDKTLKFVMTAKSGVSVSDVLAAGMRDHNKGLALFSPTLDN